jgi:hypothetical protein
VRKGKQRALPALDSHTYLNCYNSAYVPSSYHPALAQIRHFHASRPRNAVPLIPVTAAILKVSDL